MLLMTLSVAPVAADPSALGTQDAGTAQLQQALTEAGFYRGPVDGSFGAQTQQAIMAFRKEVGATRSFSWDDSLWGALNSYVKPWTPFRYGETDRVEVNLTRQVAYVFKNAALVAVLPVSSGNGEPYTNQFGSFSNAHTPTGNFKISPRKPFCWDE